MAAGDTRADDRSTLPWMVATGGGGQVWDAAEAGLAESGTTAMDPNATTRPASTHRIVPLTLTSPDVATGERISNPQLATAAGHRPDPPVDPRSAARRTPGLTTAVGGRESRQPTMPNILSDTAITTPTSIQRIKWVARDLGVPSSIWAADTVP